MKNALAFALSSLFTISAFAQSLPMVSPDCVKNLKLNEVPNSGGVYFDSKCKVGYVLPPIQNKIEIPSIAGNMNLEQCGEFKSTLKAQENLNESIGQIADEFSKTTDAEKMRELSERLALANQLLVQSIESQQKFTQIAAVDANFIYEVGTMSLVAQYQAENPKLTFVPMPLQSSKLFVQQFDRDPKAKSLTTINVSIPAFKNADNSIAFGSSIAGRITFSWWGACPPYDTATKKFDSEKLSSWMSSELYATDNYTYEVLDGKDTSKVLSRTGTSTFGL